MTRPLIDRFMEKWMPEPNSGCWLWTAFASEAVGYGQIFIPGNRHATAHRVSWELCRGPIPAGMFVLHKCDVRLCVNPHHLFLGTQQDNIADCSRKNRWARGSRHRAYTKPWTRPRGERYCTAKLTDAKVRNILGSDETNAELSRRYGVDDALICRIRKGRAWKHITIKKELL